MKLKVCGMKFPGNIREVAGIKPDYLGFIFYTRSPRYVGEQFDLKNLLGLPAATQTVGVFVNAGKAYVLQKAMKYQLDHVQLHGDESPEYCRDLKGAVRIIKAFGLHSKFDFGTLEAYKPYCDHFLFDTRAAGYGGSGKAFNWEVLSKYDNEVPFFLSGGLGPAHVKAVKRLKRLNICAVDVNSRFEVSPGLKDTALLAAFKKQLK
jgi:phosphoribosylanthranilate isomerase